MMKALKVLAITIATSLLVGSLLLQPTFACTLTEINQLLDNFQAAAKIKDEVALANLLSPNFNRVFVSNSAPGSSTPPTINIMDYSEFLNWNATTKYSLFTDYILYNRIIVYPSVLQDNNKVTVSTQCYAAWATNYTYDQEIITIVEENNNCVILNRIVDQYYNHSLTP